MPKAQKSFFSFFSWRHLLIDIVLGGICIALLFTMLQQQDALKKIEADMDRLRAQFSTKQIEASPQSQLKKETDALTVRGDKQ